MKYFKKNIYIQIVKILCFIIITYFFSIPLQAHRSGDIHKDEIRSVLGFESHPKIDEWLLFISRDMIDNHNPFYTNLKNQFPGFKCKHRYLFHWNYVGEPWTPALEDKVKAYTRLKFGSEQYREQFPDMKKKFLRVLKEEQRRRNGLINSKTEQLFGFNPGGRDGSYANFFAAMAYDLHLLGDYMSDNSDFDGLIDFNTLVNGIISNINKIDQKKGKIVVKPIKSLLRRNLNTQQKADAIMGSLKTNFPMFIQSIDNGAIKRRLEKNGFKFIPINNTWWDTIKNWFNKAS